VGRLRRSSRGARRSGAKRKLYWTGGIFQASELEVVGHDANGQGQYTAWVKWPSGDRNVSSADAEIEANDETLQRTICNANVTLNATGMVQAAVQVSLVIGLIAWDAIDAELLHEVGTVAGEAPNPVTHPGLDWILRLPFQFTRDNFQQNVGEAIFAESRAQRKLPPGTGILLSTSLIAPLQPSEVFSYDVAFDCRFLFKQGYYSS